MENAFWEYCLLISMVITIDGLVITLYSIACKKWNLQQTLLYFLLTSGMGFTLFMTVEIWLLNINMAVYLKKYVVELSLSVIGSLCVFFFCTKRHS